MIVTKEETVDPKVNILLIACVPELKFIDNFYGTFKIINLN